METPNRLRETVKWFLLNEELLSAKNLVLAAVSGGADSMALASILNSLCQELKFRLAIAHYDHRIRASGDEERALVRQFAKSLAIPFYSASGDVREQAAATGDTLEEAGRKARYRFLSGVADEIKAERIATGHSKDDQAETVMMRILHGTGIRGLAGIPTRRGRIIRPLLCISRADARGYCDEMGIHYIDDPTNDDTRIMRNRIRHELFPLLDGSYHGGVEDNLRRLALNAQEMLDCIRAKTAPLIEQNLRKSSADEWILNVARLSALDDTSIVVLFGDVFAESLGLDMDFGRVHYEQLVRLVRDARGSGKKLTLPGITVKREYENLIVTMAKRSASVLNGTDYRATLTFPGETRAAGIVVKTEIVEAGDIEAGALKSTGSVAHFALDRVTLPLVLRAPKAGDRIQPFGMKGSKKLSDIFVDKKIPSRDRQKAVVVADADEILWVVGVTTNEGSRVTDRTGRVVRITFDRD